jgi:hypothetical protein
MGIDPNTMPKQMRSCITPADRERLGITKTKQPREVTEQSRFAKWLKDEQLLPPAVWHKTNQKSTATRGCPDFIVVVAGRHLWFEFKRYGGELSPVQKFFHRRLREQGVEPFVVNTASEAAVIVQSYR